MSFRLTPRPDSGFKLETYYLDLQQRLERLDATLPGHRFSDQVRRSLYEYALVRNTWGTTNLDSGPVSLEHVSALYARFERGATPGRVPPTDREILNYFGLVDDLPTSGFDVSLDDVQQLHRDYFQGVKLDNDAKPGQWKTHDVVIAGPYGRVPTTPHAETQDALRSLLTWLNAESSALPTFVRAALFFHRFQAIHPFQDGNGRVGRLLSLWILSMNGLASVRYCPIDDEINLNREEYYLALRAADNGDLAAWVGYFGVELLNGYQRAHALGRRLQSIPPRVAPGSRRLLEHVYVHRIGTFRTKDVAGFYLRDSPRTISRRLGELEKLGFIRGSGHGAGRAYEVLSLHEVEAKGGARAPGGA